MRLDKPDEQAHHCDVQKPERERVYQVGSAGNGGKPARLTWSDGEDALTWGGTDRRKFVRESAPARMIHSGGEVIVLNSNEL